MIVVNKEPVKGKVLEPESEKNRIPSGKGHSFFIRYLVRRCDMSRLSIITPNKAQTVVEGLYRDVERRIIASPPGLCPVDMAAAFL